VAGQIPGEFFSWLEGVIPFLQSPGQVQARQAEFVCVGPARDLLQIGLAGEEDSLGIEVFLDDFFTGGTGG
jgi:hypothetical protein